MSVSKTSATIHHTLDVTGALCPLPLLKLKLCLNDMAGGESIELKASDATSLEDIPSFCRIAGHHLIKVEEHNGVYSFVVQKQADNV